MLATDFTPTKITVTDELFDELKFKDDEIRENKRLAI